MSAGRDQAYYHQIGNVAGIGKRWYYPPGTGMFTNSGNSSQGLSGNTLYAVPFVTGRGPTIDEMGLWVVSLGTAANMRFGIYSVGVDAHDLYPTTRLLDTGQIVATPTGTFRKVTLGSPLALAADAVRWLVFLADGTLTVAVTSQGPGFLGLGGSFSYADDWRGITHTFTYGALPDPFPSSSPTLAQGFWPMILVHYSA